MGKLSKIGTVAKLLAVVDSNALFEATVVAPEAIEVGDLVVGGRWRRPRLVLAIDEGAEGRTFVMREPDENRRDEKGNRKIAAASKSQWRRYEGLTRLWKAAGWAVCNGLPTED